MKRFDTKGQSDIGILLILLFIGLIVFFVILPIMGSVYRINTGEGAILTEFSGNKVPITEVGWHLRIPFLTDLKVKNIVNQNIYFPADYLELEAKFKGDQQSGAIGFDIKTTDDKVVDAGAVMQYQIMNLVQYGVMNTNPEEQMQKAFDAIVFNHLQSLSSEKIINEIEIVNKELLVKVHESNIEEQFGIQVNSVSLLRPTYTQIALQAMSEKQAIQAKSEGELNAAKNRAEAIETIAKAQKNQSEILKNVPQAQLDFNAKLTLYETLKGNQNVVWVIPENQNIVMSNQRINNS